MDTSEWYDNKYEDVCSEELSRLREQLAINKHSLDRDVEDQPVLFEEVSDRCALSVSIRDDIKENQDRLFAEKSADYRKSRSKTKDRVTDRIINDDVTSDKEYIRMVKRFNVCRNMASRWMSLKSAFEQRASMLKVMSQLYTSNYFTVNSVSGDRGSEVSTAVTDIKRRKINQQRVKHK